jgi:hypothetical protein
MVPFKLCCCGHSLLYLLIFYLDLEFLRGDQGSKQFNTKISNTQTFWRPAALNLSSYWTVHLFKNETIRRNAANYGMRGNFVLSD